LIHLTSISIFRRPNFTSKIKNQNSKFTSSNQSDAKRRVALLEQERQRLENEKNGREDLLDELDLEKRDLLRRVNDLERENLVLQQGFEREKKVLYSNFVILKFK
jgi:hypothetical protein